MAERKLEEIPLHEGETIDDLLKGKLRIIQKSDAFKYTIDALLLAHFAGEAIEGHEQASLQVLDIGCGNGVISLLLSKHPSVAQIVGVEINSSLAQMSRRSVSLNRLDDRITIIEGDIREIPPPLKGRRFDVVVSNPPYRRVGEGRLNPHFDKAVARHELALTLEELIQATKKTLKENGIACFIYGAYRLTDLLTCLRSYKIEPVRIRMVHSRINDPAKMVLVEARRGATTELVVAPPLIIYADKKSYSPEVLRIFEQG